MNFKIHKKSALQRFWRTRNQLLTIGWVAFLLLPAFNFVPLSYRWLSAVFVAVYVLTLLWLIAFRYRCPHCNVVPRARVFGYVDLDPKICSSCGHSLRLEDEQHEHPAGGQGELE